MRPFRVALLLRLLPATATGLLPYGKEVREAYFQFSPGTIYFNHGGFGATPRPVQQAMLGYTEKMEAQPTLWFASSGYHEYIHRNRLLLAKLIGSSPDDLVYLDNASAGMNAVLRSILWQKGDIVLLIGSLYAVFPNTVAWLAARYGIRAVGVEIAYPVSCADDYVVPVRKALEGLSASERSRIRVALLDHISSYPSVLLPVAQIAAVIKAETTHRAFVFVDGAHALGQVTIDMAAFRAAGVDYYVMDGHKWFMSPHGSALLWAAPGAPQAALQADVISSENVPGTSFQDRFDYIGTRDYTPWCAFGDAIDFRANRLGGEAKIIAYLHELAAYALESLPDRWSTEAVAPISMTGGLVTIRLPIPLDWTPAAQSTCAAAIGNTLRDSYGMQIIPFTLKMHNRTVHVARISAQVYLSKEDFDALAENTLVVAKLCSPGDANVTAPVDRHGSTQVEFV